MGFRPGPMGLNMKGNGKIIKLMERVNFGMLTETFLKETGKTIKLMDMVYTYM